EAMHPELGTYYLHADGAPVDIVFTENESNPRRLWGDESRAGHFKDAFHELVVDARRGAVNPEHTGTKAAVWFAMDVPAGGSVELRLRLSRSDKANAHADFDRVFATRMREADEFYAHVQTGMANADARAVQRQAFAGMIWSKQFFYFDIPEWLNGDPAHPA